MDVAAALIGIIGVAFHGIQRVGFQPGIQPLPHRILRLLQIRPAVDLRCDLRQLLTDFFLCLAIDGLLGLFARLRVNAGGIAGRYPATPRILPAIAFQRHSHPAFCEPPETRY